MRVFRYLIATILLLGAVVYGWPFVAVGLSTLFDRAESSVHLLPAGYEGPVVLVYNSPNGAPRAYEGRSRLYRIPVSGVLRTQFAPNPGWSRPAVYRVRRDGTREAVPFGSNCSDSVPGSRLQTCVMGRKWIGRPDGSLYGPEYDAYVVTSFAGQRAAFSRGDSVVDAELFPADTSRLTIR